MEIERKRRIIQLRQMFHVLPQKVYLQLETVHVKVWCFLIRVIIIHKLLFLAPFVHSFIWSFLCYYLSIAIHIIKVMEWVSDRSWQNLCSMSSHSHPHLLLSVHISSNETNTNNNIQKHEYKDRIKCSVTWESERTSPAFVLSAWMQERREGRNCKVVVITSEQTVSRVTEARDEKWEGRGQSSPAQTFMSRVEEKAIKDMRNKCTESGPDFALNDWMMMTRRRIELYENPEREGIWPGSDHISFLKLIVISSLVLNLSPLPNLFHFSFLFSLIFPLKWLPHFWLDSSNRDTHKHRQKQRLSISSSSSLWFHHLDQDRPFSPFKMSGVSRGTRRTHC